MMREEHRKLSFFLAVLTHGLIVAFLFFGVQWQTKPVPSMQVELWAGTEDAAPPAAVKPTPKPVKARPLPEKTEEAAPKPPPKAPDIAVEKPKPPKPEKPKPPVEKPKPPPPPAKPAEKPKPESTLDKIEKREQQSKPSTGTAGDKVRDKPGRLAEPVQDATGSLTALSARQQAAEAGAKSSEFDAYLNLVRNKIRRNLTYPDDAPGSPEVLLEVTLLPDMSVLDAVIIKGSGVPAYDQAVVRAILKTGQYPPLTAGVEFARLRKHKLKYRLHDGA